MKVVVTRPLLVICKGTSWVQTADFSLIQEADTKESWPENKFETQLLAALQPLKILIKLD